VINVAVAAVAVIAILALAGCLQPKEPPQLIVDESVAGDLEALALETWAQFLAVFQARSACFGDVTLRATETLDSRAGYDPDTATVTVRVPATAAILQGALVHEWAHHVEFQCRAHETLRTAFLTAQGLPPDTPWRPMDTTTDVSSAEWAGIPSEQYAEAVVELVLGGRPVSTGARIRPEAIRIVGDWAAGEPLEPALDARGE
jgi:hypothetical protein